MFKLEMKKIPTPIEITTDEIKTIDGARYGLGEKLGRAVYIGAVWCCEWDGRKWGKEGFITHPQVIAALVKHITEDDWKGRNLTIMPMEEAQEYLRKKGIQTYAYEAEEVEAEEKEDIDGAINWIKSYEILEEWTREELREFREKGWA